VSYVLPISTISALKDKIVGNGHCVPLVQSTGLVPHTSTWKRGALVKGNVNLPAGTVIATFSEEGKYLNSVDGKSHAAVYVKQDAQCITVWDQWLGQAVHTRPIAFQPGKIAKLVNDGDEYYVVE
jgi:hypothetical protein